MVLVDSSDLLMEQSQSFNLLRGKTFKTGFLTRRRAPDDSCLYVGDEHKGVVTIECRKINFDNLVVPGFLIDHLKKRQRCGDIGPTPWFIRRNGSIICW